MMRSNGGRSSHPIGHSGIASGAPQSGQALPLFAILLAVLMLFVAIVLDQGLLRKGNQDLWNALDSGALAGVSQLPGDAARAEQLARSYVHLNFPGDLPDGDIKVSYRCLIGVEDGAPRLSDIPGTCDPGSPVEWVCDERVCTAPCEPSDGNDCNVIVVTSPVTVSYSFGPVAGVLSGSTERLVAAACVGPCGAPPVAPVDLVLVIDRTSSMSGFDIINARAAADAVRKAYDPRIQWMSLSLVGPTKPTDRCLTHADTKIGTAKRSDLRRWVPLGLSGTKAPTKEDYSANDSTMAKAIACFGPSSISGGSTDLADPIRMATYELETSGRRNVRQGILLMTDGRPNVTTTGTKNYCAEVAGAARDAKAKGIEFFAVGFGLEGYDNGQCRDTSGPWVGRHATDLLANIATDSVDRGCPGASNSDGDHYFCVPKSENASTDLSKIFLSAVETLTGRTRLIKLP